MTAALRQHERGRLLGNSLNGNFSEFNYLEMPLYNPTIDESEAPRRRPQHESLAFGNARGNENPFLMTIGTVWFRWHNLLAARLLLQNPEWTDEMVCRDPDGRCPFNLLKKKIYIQYYIHNTLYL